MKELKMTRGATEEKKHRASAWVLKAAYGLALNNHDLIAQKWKPGSFRIYMYEKMTAGRHTRAVCSML